MKICRIAKQTEMDPDCFTSEGTEAGVDVTVDSDGSWRMNF